MLPILATKYHTPRAHPNRVPRRHLIQKLDEGLWHTQGVDFSRRLTLVAAPAGYGKTTMLCEWISHLEIPVAWITFDEAENDPRYFLQYLVVALQTIKPGIGETILDFVQSPQYTITQQNISIVMTSLVNEIAAITNPLILIFDDYHNLESQEIHRAVMFLLDHLPEKLSLVISTRSDPPFSLSRLRAGRQLVEIRSDNLRFSDDETSAFLRHVMQLDLPDQEVEILLDRTEGWIAGLQMAALALQARDDVAEFIQEFSGRERFVIDYLFEEVLSRQPEHIQTFLIQTSILERMSGPLCDAVLENPKTGDFSLAPTQVSPPESGQQILEYLEHANLFLVPLDDERCYYRYHHLFSDLLRHRLRFSSPELVPLLHSRVAAWFEAQGNTSEALDHWIAAKNYEKASNLLADNGYSFLVQGYVRQMLLWLQQIPDGIVYSHPWLCIFYSWGMISIGRFSEGEYYISSAENILPPISDTADPVYLLTFGHVAVVREYLASRYQDATGIIHYANLALKYLPPDDYYIRSIVTYLLGHAKYQSDQLTQAQVAYAEAADFGKKAGNIFVAVNALCALANLVWYQGELHRALNIYQEAAELATDEQGRSLPVAAEVYVGRARLYFEWNDLKGAEEDLLKTREINKLYSNFDLDVETNINLSRLRLAQEELDAAEHLIQEIEQNDRQASFRPGVDLLAYQINLYQATGNLAKVTRLTDQQDWRMEDKCLFAWADAFIAYASFLITQDELHQAYNLMEQCLTKIQTFGLWMYVIEVLIVQATILYLQSEHPLAQEKIERALSLAEKEGFIRIFVDEGEPVRFLLTSYRAQITQKSKAGDHAHLRLLTYVDKILSAFPGPAPEKTIKPSSANLAPSILVDPLTTRELEVLQLIAAGLSNKEIAEKLVVSVGTVKAHTSSIYRKLDVEGRTKAVAQAREIHII